MPSTFRAAWLGATLLSTVVLTACGGNDVLAPPDGTACTIGSIAPGDSVNGVVSSASCQAFDVNNYVVTYAQSWTLSVKKNMGYVVRLRHQPDGAAFDNWTGDLEVYGRNTHGDATFLTGWWGSFGSINGNGGQNEEMYLAGDVDRTVSIRVSTTTPADTGHYSLTVTACPVVVLGDTLVHPGIDLSTGCEALALQSAPMRLKFITFVSDTNAPDTVAVHRTAGTGYFFGYVAGPSLDVGCWNSDCISNYHGMDTVFIAYPSFNFPGQMTILAAVNRDSAATISAQVNSIPPAQMPATVTSSTSRPSKAHQGRR